MSNFETLQKYTIAELRVTLSNLGGAPNNKKKNELIDEMILSNRLGSSASFEITKSADAVPDQLPMPVIFAVAVPSFTLFS